MAAVASRYRVTDTIVTSDCAVNQNNNCDHKTTYERDSFAGAEEV